MCDEDDESAGEAISRVELRLLANALSDLFDQLTLEHPAVLADAEGREKADRISEILTEFRRATAC